MQVVSARDFRANQGKYLTAAKRGESVVIHSRYGSFNIVPTEAHEDDLTSRIISALHEVKRIEDGEIPFKPAREFLNEL